jgi:hypothetical protein
MTRDERRQYSDARYRYKIGRTRKWKGCVIVKGGRCQCHGRFARMVRCENTK